jgi:hypothetical protein
MEDSCWYFLANDYLTMIEEILPTSITRFQLSHFKLLAISFINPIAP